MIAFKFLAPGAVGPFTRRAWPLPRPGSPGSWIQTGPGALERHGVHACAAEHLSLWPDEELWIVELGGTILREPSLLVAERGRLLEQVITWNAQTIREYAAACAWRARHVAVEALLHAGLDEPARALRACADLEALRATAASIAGDAGRETPRGFAAYVAGAALRARQGRYPEASLQAAHLGVAVGAGGERAWQSCWLTQRLGLAALAARYAAPALEL